MQPLNHRQGNIDGQPAIGQIGPGSLVIGLLRRPILGERLLAASVGHRVAVGEVMHHLPHGPAVFAVGRVELGFAQAVDGSAKALRQEPHCLDVSGPDAGQTAGRRGEAANRVAEVVQICHGSNPPMHSCRMKPGCGIRPRRSCGFGPGSPARRGGVFVAGVKGRVCFRRDGGDDGGDGHDDGASRQRRPGWQTPTRAGQRQESFS